MRSVTSHFQLYVPSTCSTEDTEREEGRGEAEGEGGIPSHWFPTNLAEYGVEVISPCCRGKWPSDEGEPGRMRCPKLVVEVVVVWWLARGRMLVVARFLRRD